jgi:hypothetical protein
MSAGWSGGVYASADQWRVSMVTSLSLSASCSASCRVVAAARRWLSVMLLH